MSFIEGKFYKKTTSFCFLRKFRSLDLYYQEVGEKKRLRTRICKSLIMNL